MSRGRKTKGNPQHITLDQLKAAYLDTDASLLDAARAFGISYGSMRAVLKQHGVSAKKGDRHLVTGSVPLWPQLSDPVWLREQLATKTYRQIAQELGTTPGNIADRVRRLGLSVEGRGSAGIKLRFPSGRFGEAASNWKGGRLKVDADSVGNARILVYAPSHHAASNNGYVFEHRLVAEQVLGRFLSPEEIVHHINGDRSNNTPENLSVVTRGEHTALHYWDTVRAAKYKAQLLAAGIAPDTSVPEATPLPMQIVSKAIES